MLRAIGRVLLLTGAVGFAVAPSAGAQAPSTTMLDRHPSGHAQLGVDARGGAVVAWPAGYSGGFGSPIVASMRPAGDAFRAPRRISTADVVPEFTVAVGARGDAAVVWRQALRSGRYGLVVARGRTAGRLGQPVALPSLPRAGVDSQPAAAIDARGRLLVAWLRSSGRKECGKVVMVSVALRDGRLGGVRRVSGTCPDAALMRVALSRGGVGAVAWRSAHNVRPETTRYAVQVSVYARDRFGPARTVSTGRVWYGIVIRMYFSDHAPPHFHALYGGEEAIVAIGTGDILRGGLPDRALRMVREWASIHRVELAANWERIQVPDQPLPIEPLP